MAMVISMSDQKQRKSFRKEMKKPWMLKDYLRDDVSSCSSSGFRSYPRRQCCVSVVNDVVRSHTSSHRIMAASRLTSNRSVTVSVIQKASSVIINAVKSLPFKSSSPGEKSSGRSFLSRSFSKKVFKRWMWKKAVEKEYCEIEGWISSGVVGVEKYQPLDLSNTTTGTTFTSTSMRSNSEGKSDSWSNSEFASDYLVSPIQNDAVPVNEKAGDDRVDSVDAAITKVKENKQKEEEKEQFSPVSVMDFPDDDDDNDDEQNSSPFTCGNLRLEGTKKKLMQKLGRFECLARLEPMNLEKRIVLAISDDDESPKSSIKSSCSTPSQEYFISSESEEENDEEQQAEPEWMAEHLLEPIEAKIPSSYNSTFSNEIFLSDFFIFSESEKEEQQDQEQGPEQRTNHLLDFRISSESTEGQGSRRHAEHLLSLAKAKSPSFYNSKFNDNNILSDFCISCESKEEEVQGSERQAKHMLNLIKAEIPSTNNSKFDVDNLLVDFFRDNITKKTESSLLRVAKEWMNGRYEELLMGWEVKNKRQAYIRDMEERGEWKNLDFEKEEVGLELEDQVFACLIDELVCELNF